MKNSAKQIVKNNFIELRNQVRSLDSFEKEESILLNCLEKIISTAQNNEFENLSWRAKVGKASGQIGAKVQFENLSILRKDLQDIFRPTIDNLQTIFSKQSFSIETSVETEGQLVKKLECTIQLKIPNQKTHLELP
jgi:hypothetical protein